MNRTVLCMLAALAIAPAGADQPQLKEGLWQVRTQMLDGQGNKTSDETVSLCRDHATDQAAEAHADQVMAKDCQRLGDEHDTSNKRSSEIRCQSGDAVADTKAEISFEGDTAAHSVSRTTYTPPLHGQTADTMIQDQQYLGSCPAGMQPGDARPVTAAASPPQR
jgi:hypothetical protein